MRLRDQSNLMAEAFQAWLPSQTRRWYTVGERYAFTRDAMRLSAQLVGNAAYGADFRDDLLAGAPRRKGEVADPLAWALRHVELDRDEWAVAGINFLGMDPNKPFVQVVITSLPPETELLVPLAEQLHAEFAAFQPRAVRFNMPNPPEGADVDTYAVAGLVDELRARERSKHFGRVRLTPAEPEEAAQLAAEADPRHAPDAGLLARCQEEDLLFFAEVDGQRAGVLAARRDIDFGGKGFEVIANVLKQEFRGNGLAPAMMQHLADALPSTPSDTLWGTISPDNEPALRTAFAVGREIIGAQVWMAKRGEL